MAPSWMILCSKIGRALVAGLFLLLASLQPGLAAGAWNAGDSTLAAEAGHRHDGAAVHDHGGTPAVQHSDGEQQADGERHQPVGMDLCCEMHCVMSQAMPAASPLIQGPPAERVRADFTHAVPDGLNATVIKPPRTTS